MDNGILSKKLRTYQSATGKLTQLSDEIILEVLRKWENWPGTTADLYRDLGLSKGQMSFIIRKAKALVKKGVLLAEEDFKEIKIAAPDDYEQDGGSSAVVLLRWGSNRVLEFSRIDHVVEFFNKIEPKSKDQITSHIEVQEEAA